MAGYRVIFTYIFMLNTTVFASLASENQPSSSLITVDYEIEDVRNLVQDFKEGSKGEARGTLFAC
jgi:hypothetical protein